jgi:shikimate kinase
VFLVGFMGAGKSSVGVVLARELGLAFADTDELVRAAAGRPIDRIFAESGEPRFREIEREALARLDTDRGLVVACGGGLFACAEARRWLASRGRSVWLDVPLELIRERLERGGTPRPVWPADDPVGQRALFERRRATYWLAGMRIDARGSPEAVARRIRDRLRQVPC